MMVMMMIIICLFHGCNDYVSFMVVIYSLNY